MVNLLPIIGILCFDIDFGIRHHFGENNTFYISAGYVKWLESAGAKVVPIWANRTEDYYRDIMSKVNGVLFPGGQFWFNDEENGKAAYSARKIYDIAIEMNNNGNYFPIWGTCLGYQLLFYAASGGQTDSRKLTDLINANLPLKFQSNYRESKMFQNVPDDILKLMKNEPVIYYNHKYVVTKKIMENYGITNDWNIISTESSSNIEFSATSEHAKYPFYGVISHPEKIQFEDYPENIPHTLDAIRVSQYFANFFVEETRKNNNTFNGDEKRHLIYNFPITFIQPKFPKFRECYLFNDDTDYPENVGTDTLKLKDFVEH